MERLDLSGVWQLTALGGDHPDLPPRIPMAVPGDNLTALLRAGLVDHPYPASNELNLLWIGRCDWKLERTFELPAGTLTREPFRLRLESVDTVATIAINGTTVARNDNMFHPVDVAVPAGVLREGTNSIVVAIEAPERVAIERAGRLPYPVPHVRMPVQSPHRNLLRKVQCHAGWDWGPCLMISGLNGSLELVSATEPLLDYAPASVEAGERAWTLRVEPWFTLPEGAGPSSGVIEVVVTDPSGAQIHRIERRVVARSGRSEALELSIINPRLWWPAGAGDQPLYTVQVTAFGSTIEQRIGFRTVELRREPDSEGEGFVFVVNGRPIFAQGANWIPQDAVPGLATEADLRRLLESARAANMNMIRVWGGGTYESTRFYDLCDELGLLIWQDFMFACAMYPADRDFLASVRKEVRHQVLRLRHHASIALWCGNNENVGAFGWFEETKTNRDRYLIDYDRLNELTVGDACRELDPGRTFWPSSPSDGPGDYSRDWTADRKGDMHYWSVWHGGEPFSSYRSVVPRFCSEFGFQSFPSLEMVRTYASADQHNVTAPEMEHHQRHPRGNAIIMATMARYYRFPDGFSEQIYLSQVQQAHAIRTAIEYWRTRRPRSMGALYWQLNDNWPVASWSSIEYGGRWKLLHYAARRFFAPLLCAAIPIDDAGRALSDETQPPAAWEIYLVNDTTAPMSGTLERFLVRFDASAAPAPHRIPVELTPESSTRVDTIDASTLPHAPGECFAFVRFTPDGDTAPVAEPTEATILFAEPKRCALARATITLSVDEPTSTGETMIGLLADRPALDVAVDQGARRGRFSDNMITLLPGVRRTITWLPEPDEPGNATTEDFSVAALNDVGTRGRAYED